MGEQIALKGEQLVARAAIDEGLVSATVQSIKALADKVEAKCKPELVEICS